MKIRIKLMIGFSLIAIIVMLFLGALSYSYTKNLLQTSGQTIITGFSDLEHLADLKVKELDTFFAERKANMQTLQDYYNIKTNLPIMIEYANNRTHPKYLAAKEMLDGQLKTFQESYRYLDLMLLSPEGIIVYCTNDKHEAVDLDMPLPNIEGNLLEKARKGITFSGIFANARDDNMFTTIMLAPEYDFGGDFIGFNAIEIDVSLIFNLTQDYTGLGETGETLIGQKDWGQYKTDSGPEEEHLIFLNPLRHDPEAALKRIINYGSEDAIPMQKATQGNDGSGYSVDYRGEPILAAWRYVPSIDWGIVAKIDVEEMEAPIANLRTSMILISVLLIICVTFYSFFLSRSFSKPIDKLYRATKELMEGKLNTRVNITTKDELEELGKAFNMTVVRLKELDKAKTEFLSSASHELKSPLVPIIGNLQMMNANEFGKLTKKQKEILQVCYRNAENLSSLVEEMLDLSKLELKKVTVQKEKIDIAKLAREVVENFSIMAKEHYVDLKLNAPKSLLVFADKLRITQVLSNLVKNALHYAHGTKKKRKPVSIEVSAGSTTARVSVIDQGPGISKENQKKLFNKFFRIKKAESSAGGGSGLGLCISKSLIHLHGGVLTLKSQPGKGSAFSFTIPLGERKQ